MKNKLLTDAKISFIEKLDRRLSTYDNDVFAEFKLDYYPASEMIRIRTDRGVSAHAFSRSSSFEDFVMQVVNLYGAVKAFDQLPTHQLEDAAKKLEKRYVFIDGWIGNEHYRDPFA